MAECRITTVTEDNLNDCVALAKRFAAETPVYAGQEFDPEGTLEFFRGYSEGIRGAYEMSFVAQVEGKVAGFLLVTMYKHPCLVGKTCCDELMYTHPGLRGMGIGGVLVEEYKEWAEAMGADLVLLGSSSGINADFAEKFYAGHGFQPAGMLAKLGDLDVHREDEPQDTEVS